MYVVNKIEMANILGGIGARGNDLPADVAEAVVQAVTIGAREGISQVSARFAIIRYFHHWEGANDRVYMHAIY